LRIEPHLAYRRWDGQWVRERLEPSFIKLRQGTSRSAVRARVWSPERVVDVQVSSLVLRSHEPEFIPGGAWSPVHYWNGDPSDCRLVNLEWQANVRGLRKVSPRMSPEEFEEEYRFFRSFGWSHKQIADKLGFQLAAFEQRVRSYQCWAPTPEEREMQVTFDRLVASGQPFIASQVSSDEAVEVLIRMGLKAGRIKVKSRTALYNGDYRYETYIAA
jgi:hypothetical protein